MKEQVSKLGRAVGSLLTWLGRSLWAVLRWLGLSLAKCWQLLGLRFEANAKRRERREALEQLGKMVYLLHKRNLVRNRDLLAECEKVATLDVELDQVGARADAVRLARSEAAVPALSVASVPVEIDASV